MASFLRVLLLCSGGGGAPWAASAFQTLPLETLGLRREASTFTPQSDRVDFPSDSLTTFGSHFARFNASNTRGRAVIGIGVPKSGSTFMFQVMRKHPHMLAAVAKETKYFKKFKWSECAHLDPEDGSPAGQKLTASELYVRSCYGAEGLGSKKALLEFSPGYLALQGKMHRDMVDGLRAVGADMDLRFIVVLRDPVNRSISAMNMHRKNRQHGFDVTDEQLSRMMSTSLQDDSYAIASGDYATNLQKWLKAFPDKSSVLVVRNSALNDVETWRRVFAHSGVAVPTREKIQSMLEEASTHYQKGQASKYRRSGTEYFVPSKAARIDLERYYAPRNKKLWELLDVKPWW